MKALLYTVFFAGAATASSGGNVVMDWNRAAMEAIRTNRTAPPMASRALAIAHTAMYDAWSAYDSHARPVHLSAGLRGHGGDDAQRAAISYAAYRTLVDLLPASAASFESTLRGLGYEPAEDTVDPDRPEGIGNLAAQAVLEFRHHDGSNQLGDLNPGAYSDYTGYRAVNAPDRLDDPGRWQPLVGADGQPQRFLAPQWARVTPFGMADGAEVRPPAPPAYGSTECKARAEQLRGFSAGLGDREKMIAEYWEDGGGTVTPPGHWNVIAQGVVERDSLSLEQTVKLFFMLNNAAMDAGIAAWDAKTAFDYGRPITQLRAIYGGQNIEAWAGPGLGTKVIPGELWQPYLSTPPFSEYVSGHSTFSAASATILRLFTGGDAYGASVTFAPGSSRIEPGASPAAPVTLSWATFSEAADEAGLSRRLGGIHFEDADFQGRAMGRMVAQKVWDKAQALFGEGGDHGDGRRSGR